MAFPSTISSFTNPNSTDRLNSPSHSSIETAQNTALLEIERAIGTDSSTLGTIIGDLRSASSGGGGHIQAVNKGGTGLTSYAKGDLLVASSASVITKVAIGSDGKVLQADSTQLAGVNWATATFSAGMIMMWSTPTAPSGWLGCDGAAYAISSYATLYSVLGSIYGVNFTTSVFNVPNFSSRVPIGIGSAVGGGFTGKGSVAGGSVLGSVVTGYWTGEETHKLTVAEMPSHTHTFPNSFTNTGGADQAPATTGGSTNDITVPATGGDGSHNTIQPVMGINFIIKT